MDRPNLHPFSMCRLNLESIESTLRKVQHDFPRINKSLVSYRDPMNDVMIDNLVSGYSFIDTQIGDTNNLFALGNLHNLIEINTLVLCGTDPAKREQFKQHLKATETQFYNQTPGGVRDIIEWCEMHKRVSIWMRVAGVYIRMLSHPQLFIEGNHRTGAVIMSYLLGREGKPLFVLSVDNVMLFLISHRALET